MFAAPLVITDQASRLVLSELRRIADHRSVALPGLGTSGAVAWLADELRFRTTGGDALAAVIGPGCSRHSETWPGLEYAARLDMSSAAPAFYGFTPTAAGHGRRLEQITAREALRRLFDRAMTFVERHLLLPAGRSTSPRRYGGPGRVATAARRPDARMNAHSGRPR